MYEAMHILIDAVNSINKSMGYGRTINRNIEANIKESRKLNKKAPLEKRSA
jgi:hypothetical protein